jgi:hypothetical protein
MKKYGEILKVKIPMEELRNGKKRSKGIAFVTFKTRDQADKAISDGEVCIDFATLNIERALKSLPKPQESQYP